MKYHHFTYGAASPGIAVHVEDLIDPGLRSNMYAMTMALFWKEDDIILAMGNDHFTLHRSIVGFWLDPRQRTLLGCHSMFGVSDAGEIEIDARWLGNAPNLEYMLELPGYGDLRLPGLVG